jgi:hypothetical protein
VAEEQVADVSQGEVAPSVLIDDTDTTSPATDWKNQLPDDLKDHQALRNITDVGVLAKTMIHAQSMVGAEKIAVPGKWATDEDWDQVWNKLGRPEDATGYELELGEGAETDAEFIDSFRQAAHGAGLSERQAQSLAGWYMEMAAQHSPEQAAVDIQTAKASAESELRKEYGKAFDDRITLGDNLVGEFAADGLLDLRLEDGTPLVNNPAFIRTMIATAHYISESVSEDKLIGDKSSGAITPDEAQDKVQELMREDSPYWDNRHPMHNATVQQVLALQEQMHPDEE